MGQAAREKLSNKHIILLGYRMFDVLIDYRDIYRRHAFWISAFAFPRYAVWRFFSETEVENIDSKAFDFGGIKTNDGAST